MKITVVTGVAAGLLALLCGCASTDFAEGRTDANARWVVVSTNDPVSSARMDRDSSRIPVPNPSVLLSSEGQAARQEIESSGIPPLLKKKMLDGEVLTLADIEELGRYKVSEPTILKYLQGTRAIYILNTEDINRLQQAGITKAVTDYMLASVNQRPVTVVKKYYRYHYYDPWWDYPRFYHHHYFPYHHHYHHGHYHRGGGGLRIYRR